MRHILIGAIAIALIFAFVSEVYATNYYTYESVACGPQNTGVTDFTYTTNYYGYSTSQWNWQGGTTWWGYSDSSKNGCKPKTSQNVNGFGVCARAYNSLFNPYNKNCSKSDGKYSYAFAGWSSNMGSQQREVYCTS